jgi:tRNA-dependent cyclodipeptide synthase
MVHIAKVGGLAKYQEIDLTSKRCVMPISVGNPEQVGEKFQAALKTVVSRFGSVDLILADTLQRFNFMAGCTQAEALAIVQKKGDDWLAEHQPTLSRYPHRLIRWETCCQDPAFDKWLIRIKDLYDTQHDYQCAVNEDVHIFLERYQRRSAHSISEPDFKRNSLAYFFEETAVIFSYFMTQEYHFFIYPGAIPISISCARRFLREEQHAHLINDLRLYFRQAKALG